MSGPDGDGCGEAVSFVFCAGVGEGCGEGAKSLCPDDAGGSGAAAFELCPGEEGSGAYCDPFDPVDGNGTVASPTGAPLTSGTGSVGNTLSASDEAII